MADPSRTTIAQTTAQKKKPTTTQESGIRVTVDQVSSMQTIASSAGVSLTSAKQNSQAISKSKTPSRTQGAGKSRLDGLFTRDIFSGSTERRAGASDTNLPRPQAQNFSNPFGADISITSQKLDQEHYQLSVDLFNCPSVPGIERISVIGEVFPAIRRLRVTNKQLTGYFNYVRRIDIAEDQVQNIRTGLRRLYEFKTLPKLTAYLSGCLSFEPGSDRGRRRDELARQGCAPVSPMRFLAMVMVRSNHQWANMDEEERRIRQSEWRGQHFNPPTVRQDAEKMPESLSNILGVPTYDDSDQNEVDNLGSLYDSMGLPGNARAVVFGHVYQSRRNGITPEQLSAFFKCFYNANVDSKAIAAMSRRVQDLEEARTDTQLSKYLQGCNFSSETFKQMPMPNKIKLWRGSQKSIDKMFEGIGEVGRQVSLLEWKGVDGLFGAYVPSLAKGEGDSVKEIEGEKVDGPHASGGITN